MTTSIKQKISGLVVSGAVFLPVLASAQSTEQTCTNMGNLTGLFKCAAGLVGNLMGLLVLFAWLFFLYGVAMYIKDYDNETKRTDSRQFMIYGIIALFIMTAVWALVGILQRTFGISPSDSQFKTSTSWNPALNSNKSLDSFDPAKR